MLREFVFEQAPFPESHASTLIELADGTVLDTGDDHSRAAFQASHGPMLARLDEMARRVKADRPLARRIGDKFKIKNTTGYSLNALLDYTDPFDIIAHLMIGSEGTLAFISRDTMPAALCRFLARA